MDISEFKYLIWDYSRKINEQMSAILSAWGVKYRLSALQLRILMEIQQNGSHTVGSLANSVMVAGTNISTMCKKLESLGLLRRVRDLADERVVRIELTAQGSQIVEEIDLVFEQILKENDEEINESFTAIIYAMEKLKFLLNKFDDQVLKKQQ